MFVTFFAQLIKPGTSGRMMGAKSHDAHGVAQAGAAQPVAGVGPASAG